MLRSRGREFRFLELAIVCVLMAVSANWLMGGLYAFERESEFAQVDLVVRTLQQSIKIKMGLMMVDQETRFWGRLAEENPLLWAERPLRNYCGEVEREESVLPGCWCYDRLGKQIVYRFLWEGGMLKYRLRAVYSESPATGGPMVEAVVLEPVFPRHPDTLE